MIAPRSSLAALLLGILPPCVAWAQPAPPATDPVMVLQQTMASAEESLREGELQVAESRYRAALMQAWMLVGGVAGAEGRLEEARLAFERASTSTAGSAAGRRVLLRGPGSGRSSTPCCLSPRLARPTR